MTNPLDSDDTLPGEAFETEDTVAGGDTHPSGSRPGMPLAQGDKIGRYVVLSKLGVGGMGVVHSAYDPELDRKVAIKLLLPAPGGTSQTAGGGRLLREAQALGKLDHPNVVAVHDVGTLGDRVFLAMDFVEGETLGKWLAKGPPIPDILDAFRRAGLGLAAAHAKGIVHRDFKPDNVMISPDGRVRVMDFGLARTEGSDAPRPAAAPTPENDALREQLTREGAIMGTPAYMSPEQHLGAETDARTDEFSYCVALWEALYGEPPFAGDGYVALMMAVTQGRLRRPPRTAGVNAWVRSALERGLSVDADARWPDMQTLLDALGRAKTRQTRRRLAGAALVSAALVVGSWGYGQWDEGQRMAACEKEGAVVEQLWNDGVATEIRAAMVDTGLSFAATSADRARPWIDEFAEDLRKNRVEACRRHSVRRDWDAETYSRAQWCFERRKMGLATFLEQLSEPSRISVQFAVSNAAGLGTPSSCLDDDYLRRTPVPPNGPAREEVRRIHAELERAASMSAAGEYASAIEHVEGLEDAIQAVDWPPITASTRKLQSRLFSRAGRTEDAERVGVEAYTVAAKAGAWASAADAAMILISSIGSQPGRANEGRLWARNAEVATSFSGDVLGLRESGQANNLGLVENAAGNVDQALALQQRALEIRLANLGERHPRVGMSYNDLAIVYYTMGDKKKAAAMFEKAAMVKERALGPEHPDVASSVNNIGAVYSEMGEYAKSKVALERALKIYEGVLDPQHVRIAETIDNLAVVSRALGEHEAAYAYYSRAIPIFEKARGTDHPDVAYTLCNFVVLLVDMGRLDEARTTIERALGIYTTALGANDPSVAVALGNYAEVLLALGDTALAREKAERALAILEPLEGEQDGEAVAHFALARALVATDGDREQAIAHADRAREAFARAGAGASTRHNAVTSWLDEHTDDIAG